MQSLDHLRVIDMSQVMAGPFCAMMLADHGADVVKVEPIGAGDATRRSLGSLQPWGRVGRIPCREPQQAKHRA